MSFDNRNNQGGFKRPPMVQGKWECAECHKEITELPFKPDGTRPVYCRECHGKRRDKYGR